MIQENRQAAFERLFPQEKPFRWKQIETALFGDSQGWERITTLSGSMREMLAKEIPWTSLTRQILVESKDGETSKAALRTIDGRLLETVLMRNARGHRTVCVSSQIGCAMNCSFCATGKMGFVRNLSADEIVDQYRFWAHHLRARVKNPEAITNIVYMGMGEPMANYENIRSSLRSILANTDIGPTRITVSSVGILPQLTKLLDDPLWPPVRVAISLHSADPRTRKEIVPTSYDSFLDSLATWSKEYIRRCGNRRHHLTFEHVMLDGINDTEMHAKKLASFVNSIGTDSVRVNLMYYNPTQGNDFKKSIPENVLTFEKNLKDHGVTATVRKSMGTDIDAACGQLIASQEQTE